MAKKTGALKKRVVKVEPTGQAHVHSSFNNIIVTLTNNNLNCKYKNRSELRYKIWDDSGNIYLT